MSESQTTPQPTREARARDARVKPLYLVIGGLVIATVIGVVILLLTGKNTGVATDTGAGGITPTAGHFTFHIDAPQVLMTSPGANPNRAAKAAKPAAQQVEKLIHDFYVEAYLDPAKWDNAAYDGVFDSFSEGAKAEAMGKLDAMTAGSQAADTIDTVNVTDASLKERVLMDPNGQPYSVVAVVTFTASADMKDGSTGTMTSQGQYILEKTGSGWQVTSFSVTRDVKGGGATGTTSASTPTAVAS